MNHDFEDIEVKSNALELLENTLRRKRKRCMIGTGAMTDPYIPLEQRLQHTRKALLLIEKYGFGVALQTKSSRVLRDLDVLKRINEKTKAVVQITLTTADDTLCKIIEPNVSTTRECPILPYINDTQENIRAILDMCVEAKVRGVLCFGMGVTMREGNREYFYRQLDRHFPHLKQRYIREFGNNYVVNSPKNNELMKLYHRTCSENGIMHSADEIFEYLHRFEEKNAPQQLSLW